MDTLAVEEPLEVRHGADVLNVTMRTPGDDFDLVAGWLVAEGLVRASGDLVSASYCPGPDAEGHQTYNVVEVVLADGVGSPAAAQHVDQHRLRRLRDGLDRRGTGDSPYDVPATRWCRRHVLASLPDRLRAAQRVFDRTGGLHAAGLFAPDGTLLCAREDVGRHNAVDKVVGWAVRDGRLPLRGTVLQVSGRASFELVQKAVVAGIPVLSAVSAPSSLAAELAEESGLTLAGFVRAGGFNLYSRPERVPERVTGPADC